ncbi:MAG: hypothetical protein FJX76_20880 [Armatimonadetes bacterium]|nr:hypothetical protein [Armatimonadota bacterium]
MRFDAVTGLHYMRQRWFDAGLQRFVSRDYLHSDNRYEYAYNRPTSLVDTNGLRPEGMGDFRDIGASGRDTAFGVGVAATAILGGIGWLGWFSVSPFSATVAATVGIETTLGLPGPSVLPNIGTINRGPCPPYVYRGGAKATRI